MLRQDFNIDFATDQWHDQFISLGDQHIGSLTLINFSPQLTLPDIRPASIQNLGFKNSQVDEFPDFLHGLRINLLSFVDVIFNQPELSTGVFNSVQRLGLYGPAIQHIPPGLFSNKDIQHIFIEGTNIQELDFSKAILPQLQEIHIHGNLSLANIPGSFNAGGPLYRIDLFENPLLVNVSVDVNNRTKQIRLGAYNEPIKVPVEFNRLLHLQEVQIENRNQYLVNLDFLEGKNVRKLKINWPHNENIPTISGLTDLQELELTYCLRSIIKMETPNQLISVKKLKVNLRDKFTYDDLAAFLMNFHGLEHVMANKVKDEKKAIKMIGDINIEINCEPG